jgi:hypothetical protein
MNNKLYVRVILSNLAALLVRANLLVSYYKNVEIVFFRNITLNKIG